MHLGALPQAVIIWHMQGCGHCAEFLPRAKRLAQRARIPIFALDVHENERLANTYGVQQTPTVQLLHHGVVRGALTADQHDDASFAQFIGLEAAPAPRRARILLAEKRVTHESIPVDLRSGE
jgi:thiol-disulfide isomerase/thioredoxin